jgi:hypothetical protein
MDSDDLAVRFSQVYESEPLEDALVLTPRLAVRIACPASFDCFIRVVVCSPSGTNVAESFMWSELVKDPVTSFKISNAAVSATLQVRWAPKLRPIQVHGALYFSQFYSLDTVSFADESVVEPQVAASVVRAFLTAAVPEIERSTNAWALRCRNARIQQRVFASADEARSKGFHSVDVKLVVIKAKLLGPRTAPDDASRMFDFKLPAFASSSKRDPGAAELDGGVLGLEVCEDDCVRKGLTLRPFAEGSRRRLESGSFESGVTPGFTSFVASCDSYLRMSWTSAERSITYSCTVPLCEGMEEECWVKLRPLGDAATGVEVAVR